MTHGIDPRPFSNHALYRYGVVPLIRARLLAGADCQSAIQYVAQLEHPRPSGELDRVSVRSAYRWFACYEADGMAGREDVPRKQAAASRVLSADLLSFLVQERELDPVASIPELLRRAREAGRLKSTTEVDRTTVYRALRRMQVPTGRAKKERGRYMRHFPYAHRIEMVLADGKHFRAGAKRLRRVALFLIDDATRLGLQVVVGTSESAELFLRAFYETLCAKGRMGTLYLDRGPGFIAKIVAEVCRRLELAPIHGERRYPQGHGLVERFNQTAGGAVLPH